ncbi:MAG: diacylglycerol kinase family protein [Oscillospiraceae bacterium]
MIKNILSFFKGFAYAFKGIIYCIRTQRNMRFHICAMGAVIFLSSFYDLSRSECALLALVFASVISSEAVNTAVEAAVDLTTEGKRSFLAEKAKDCAAGAVLISAVFAAAAGIFLFWDTEVFHSIYLFFAENPLYIIAVIIYIALSIFFIFGINNERKE